jgi:type I restriction enzyme R subunit
LEKNRAVHRMLVDGVSVEYRRKDGSIAGAQAPVMDFDDPKNNDRLAVNKFTVSEGQHTRQPDVVLFVNGMPLAVIELKTRLTKTPRSGSPSGNSRRMGLRSRRSSQPTLRRLRSHAQARVGSLGAGKEWFKPWRTITGREHASSAVSELQVVLEGVFDHRSCGPPAHEAKLST